MTDPKRSNERHPLPGEPSAKTRDAIRDAILADLAPVRPRRLGARMLVFFVAAVVALALGVPTFGMVMPAPDLGRAVIAGLIVLLAATLTITASFSPVRRWRFSASAKLLFVGLLLVGWVIHLVSLARTGAMAGAMQPAALVCGVRAVLAGMVAGVAALWAFQYADPWSPRRSGALIGAAAGCVASAGVGISCGKSELGHLLLGHGGVVLLLAVLSALVAPRALKP
jgi:hypothetical protein